MEILSLGEKIKRKRKELNMTLKDLAAERITPGQISLVESGKSNPSMDLLEYLAASLNTSVEYLMESEESQAEKICEYYENIAQSYIFNGDYIQGENYAEQALYYAENYNLEYRKAKNFYLRGVIYMEKKELALAQQFFLSANTIFIKNNNYEDVVSTFIKLGIITLGLNAYHSSNSYFQQAEKVFSDNDIGDEFILAQIYYYISYTNFKLDNIDKAISYSFLSKEKFKQIDEKKEYANSVLLISEEYSKSGNIDNAIKYSKKALNLFRELNDIDTVSDIENSLGMLFYEFGNFEESFIHLNKAKEIRKNNNENKLFETLTGICENHIKLKDIDSARKILDEMNSILNSCSQTYIVNYYLLKCRVEMLEGQLNEAESTLLEVLGYVKSVKMKKEEAEIDVLLGKFYMDSSKKDEAVKYLNLGVDILKDIGIIKNL
ncbi:MAG: tetratricopeptide repeat protein [Bacillota bacterium]|nr:tetratricopeptide repeat protein [Bacillota bacterium]